jgi:hypothetical protein
LGYSCRTAVRLSRFADCNTSGFSLNHNPEAERFAIALSASEKPCFAERIEKTQRLTNTTHMKASAQAVL